MTPTLKLPKFPGWGILESWATSDPATIYRMNARIGCGDKADLIGQSQIFRSIYADKIVTAPSGLCSFVSWQGTSGDPADTTSSPVARYSVTTRPMTYIIEPQMGAILNGVTAFADRVGQYNGGCAICVVDQEKEGTAIVDLVADVDPLGTGRDWAQAVEIANFAGKDCTPIVQWYTSDSGLNAWTAVMDALVRKVGTYAAQNYLGDGTILESGYRMGISLPSRATSTSAGPFDFDNFGLGRERAQVGQAAWAAAWSTYAVLGPANTDMAIDNDKTATGSGSNLGGPHESYHLPEGSYRLGYRMGETYLRARGMSPTPYNSYVDRTQITINGGRTVITAKVKLLNAFGTLKTQGGAALKGWEIATGSVGTVTFTGLPANNDLVSLNGTSITFKTSGAAGAQLNIAADVTAMAAALAAYVNANLSATYIASSSAGVVTLKSVLEGTAANALTLSKSGANITLSGATMTGGTAWTRTGFTAAIADNETVTLTKTSGAWPENVKVTYLRGGPFSYGTSEELNYHYKGSLYDGCEADGGLGWPVLGFGTEQAVTV